MPGRSPIEWCDFTSNPIRAWHGATGKRGWHCVKIAAGCKNCYAERLNIFRGNGVPYTADGARKLQLSLNMSELERIGRMRPRGPFKSGGRPILFLQDMGDLFENRVTDEMLDTVFTLIEACARRLDLLFVLLTKRVARMYSYLERRGAPGNAIISCSIATQRDADENLPRVIATPAACRMVSAEPLVESVRLKPAWLERIHWLIYGGESGPPAKVRPCNLAWGDALQIQCRDAGVPFFRKQEGSSPFYHRVDAGEGTLGSGSGQASYRFASIELEQSIQFRDRKGGDMSEWDPARRVRQFPALAREGVAAACLP